MVVFETFKERLFVCNEANMSAKKWFKSKLNKSVSRLVLLTILGALSSLALIAVALIANQFIIEVQTNGLVNIGNWIAVLISVIVLQILIGYANRECLTYIAIKYRNVFLIDIYGELMKSDLTFLRSMHTGELLNRITSDLDTSITLYFSLIPSAVSIAIKLIIGATVLMLVSWELTLICAGFGLILATVILLLRTRYKTLYKRVQNANGRYKSFLQESFVNVEMVKTYGIVDKMQDNLADMLDDTKKHLIDTNRLSNIMGHFVSLMLNITMYTAIVVGAMLLSTGKMQFNQFVTVIMFMQIMRAPFSEATSISTQYFTMTAAIERVFGFVGHYNESSVTVNDFDKVVFDNVSFGYIEDKPVLQDASLTINRGDKITIIGPSGQGKSTFLKLLLNLYTPTSGEIDMFNGEEKSNVNVSLFAYVPQNNLILSGSVIDNLRLVKSDASMEELENACRLACIHDEIVSMPNGYETKLVENGGGLSTGQVQRLSIARSILSDRKVIVLDEATSGLDPDLERRLLDSLYSMQGYTIINVTHRMAVLEYTGRLIKIEAGRLEELNA